MTLGAHFAITPTQREKLEACADDGARVYMVTNEIEQNAAEEDWQDTEKAWDAIHRCLSEFPPDTPWFYPIDPARGAYALPEDHGSYPLKLCILGGKRMTDDESEYFIRLIEPSELDDLSAALEKIDRAEMRDRYFRHCKGAWPEFGEDDFEYTWEYFDELRPFFRRVAGTGKSVIFTASQ